MVNKISDSVWKNLFQILMLMEESSFWLLIFRLETSKKVTIEDTPDTGKVVLSDDVINILQNMLNPEYADVKGLQDPVLR